MGGSDVRLHTLLSGEWSRIAGIGISAETVERMLAAIPAQKFLSKLEQNASGCHLFKGALSGSGYGYARGPDGKLAPAHRIAMGIHIAREVPSFFHIVQKCGEKRCCNPDHLSFKGDHESQFEEWIKGGWNDEE